jgi:hypothetical protein
MADKSATKPCLLIASRRVALDALAPLLRRRFDLQHAETLGDAERLLEQRVDIDGVLSTVSFDDHRMFDLLRLVKAKYPEIPFIACRARDTELTKISLEGVRIASDALGASVFVDITALADRYGDGELSAKVCGLIEMQLPVGRR